MFYTPSFCLFWETGFTTYGASNKFVVLRLGLFTEMFNTWSKIFYNGACWFYILVIAVACDQFWLGISSGEWGKTTHLNSQQTYIFRQFLFYLNSGRFCVLLHCTNSNTSIITAPLLHLVKYIKKQIVKHSLHERLTPDGIYFFQNVINIFNSKFHLGYSSPNNKHEKQKKIIFSFFPHTKNIKTACQYFCNICHKYLVQFSCK